MLLVCWPLRNEIFLITGTVATVVYFGVLALLRTADGFERAALAQGWKKLATRLPGRPSAEAVEGEQLDAPRASQRVLSGAVAAGDDPSRRLPPPEPRSVVEVDAPPVPAGPAPSREE